MSDFAGKTVLITGASRGIGAAAARRFASLGAHVILAARTVSDLEKVDDAIQTDGNGAATLVPIDLRELDTIDAMIANIAARFGTLDVLVGNAGILGDLRPLNDVTNKLWDEVMTVNVTANFRLLRAAHPLLKQADNGRAIFMSSKLAGNVIAPFWGLMATSKAALQQMVKTYAAEQKKTSIRANCIDPGTVNTAMLKQAYPGADLTQHPSPEDIADLFVQLASPDYALTGQVVKAGS